MTVFKTLDIRGMSFFHAYTKASKALAGVKANGILEIILDKKRDFTEAFQRGAEANGYQVSDINENGGLIRLFIQKVNQFSKTK